MEGGDQVVGAAFTFGEDIGDARGFGFAQDLSGGVHGEKNERRRRGDDRDFACGIEAVHDRHGEIEDDEIGVQAADLFHSNLTIFGFAANVPVGVLLDAGTNGFAENRAVIYDQDFSQLPPLEIIPGRWRAGGARSATNKVSRASVMGREGVTILETLYCSVRNLTVGRKNLGGFCVLERTEFGD